MSDREQDKQRLREAWVLMFRNLPVPEDRFLGGYLGQAWRAGFADDPAGCVIMAFEVAMEDRRRSGRMSNWVDTYTGCWQM